MNKCKLLMVTLAIMMTLPCFARKRKVELREERRKDYRSLFDKLPVEAWVEDDNKELLLEFSENVATVQVTVTNAAGQVVYSQTVDTDTTPSLIVTLDEVQNAGMKVSVSDGENLVYGELNI